LETVIIPRVATQRFLDFVGHLDTLVGELTMIAARVDLPRSAGLERLLLLLEGLDGPFAAVRQSARTAATRAARSGAPAFALTLELPRAAGGLIGLWNRLLDEADWACSRGVLLTRPMPPDLVELRRWIGAQISAALPRA